MAKVQTLVKKPEPDDTVGKRMTITPEMAGDWLRYNLHNRGLKKSTVQAYSRDMKEGDWCWTGDPIRFDKTGALIDGQHRLEACVLAGVPFESTVIRDLDENIMRFLDRGIKRTVADSLHLEGHQNSLILGAAARWLYYFKHGAAALSKSKVTSIEVLKMADQHPQLEESCKAVDGAFGPSPSLLAAVHYVGAVLLDEKETADEFVTAFVSGNKFYEGDAAHVWRERLIRNKEGRTRILQEFLQRGTTHSWNLFRDRIPCAILRVPDFVAFNELDYKKL